MVDREVFGARLGHLEELLRDLRRLAGVSRDAFLSDRAIQAQAERWLHLAAECTLDLAHHIIADRGWRTPSTYRDTFRILSEEGVLPQELSAAMEEWAGLRNVLVHLYMKLDHERIWEVLTRDLDQLEAFAAAMLKAADEE